MDKTARWGLAAALGAALVLAPAAHAQSAGPGHTGTQSRSGTSTAPPVPQHGSPHTGATGQSTEGDTITGPQSHTREAAREHRAAGEGGTTTGTADRGPAGQGGTAADRGSPGATTRADRQAAAEEGGAERRQETEPQRQGRRGATGAQRGTGAAGGAATPGATGGATGAGASGGSAR